MCGESVCVKESQPRFCIDFTVPLINPIVALATSCITTLITDYHIVDQYILVLNHFSDMRYYLTVPWHFSGGEPCSCGVSSFVHVDVECVRACMRVAV